MQILQIHVTDSENIGPNNKNLFKNSIGSIKVFKIILSHCNNRGCAYYTFAELSCNLYSTSQRHPTSTTSISGIYGSVGTSQTITFLHKNALKLVSTANDT